MIRRLIGYRNGTLISADLCIFIHHIRQENHYINNQIWQNIYPYTFKFIYILIILDAITFFRGHFQNVPRNLAKSRDTLCLPITFGTSWNVVPNLVRFPFGHLQHSVVIHRNWPLGRSRDRCHPYNFTFVWVTDPITLQLVRELVLSSLYITVDIQCTRKER